MGRRVCGNADGLLGDAHDVADVAVFHAHLVEDEEEGIFALFDSSSCNIFAFYLLYK